MTKQGELLKVTEGSPEPSSQPKSKAIKSQKAKEKPEAKWGYYKLSFGTEKDSPGVILPGSADKALASRTPADYIIYPVVAMRAKLYIADAFGFTKLTEEEIAGATKPEYNRVADGEATAAVRGGVHSGVLPTSKHGSSYGIVFNGEIYQQTLPGATGNEPIRGGVVRVMVPSFVRTYHMIKALKLATNVSAEAKAAIIGLVTPGGKRILWGTSNTTQVDG